MVVVGFRVSFYISPTFQLPPHEIAASATCRVIFVLCSKY